MFNSIYKLFNYVVIDICGNGSLSQSDMQYGYITMTMTMTMTIK